MNISFVHIFLNVWTSFEFINIFWLNKHLFNRRTFFKKIGEQIFIFIFVNGHFFQIPEYVLNTWSFFQNHEHDFISRPFFQKIVIFYNFVNSFAKTSTFFESAKFLWFSKHLNLQNFVLNSHNFLWFLKHFFWKLANFRLLKSRNNLNNK